MTVRRQGRSAEAVEQFRAVPAALGTDLVVLRGGG